MFVPLADEIEPLSVSEPLVAVRPGEIVNGLLAVMLLFRMAAAVVPCVIDRMPPLELPLMTIGLF